MLSEGASAVPWLDLPIPVVFGGFAESVGRGDTGEVSPLRDIPSHLGRHELKSLG